MRLRFAMLLVAAASLSPLAATADDDYTDRWERTVPLTGRPTLKVISNDGRVRVGLWDRRAIGMRVTTRNKEIGDDVRVIESHTGNDVRLEVKEWPIRIGFMWIDRSSILIEVWMPRDADLDVHTGDGDITVPGLHGRVDLHTGDGDILLENARGMFRLRSGDGRITASGLDGSLTATTGDGRVRVAGRFDALTLRSGDGPVTAEVAAGSRVREQWSVTTGDGAVTLLVPDDLRADVSVHTGDGSITVDLPMTLRGRVTQRSVRGALNGGGPPMILRSGDGSIRLAPLAAR